MAHDAAVSKSAIAQDKAVFFNLTSKNSNPIWYIFGKNHMQVKAKSCLFEYIFLQTVSSIMVDFEFFQESGISFAIKKKYDYVIVLSVTMNFCFGSLKYQK